MSICNELRELDQDEIWLFQPERNQDGVCSNLKIEAKKVLNLLSQNNSNDFAQDDDTQKSKNLDNILSTDPDRSISECSFTNSSIDLLEDSLSSKRNKFLAQMLIQGSNNKPSLIPVSKDSMLDESKLNSQSAVISTVSNTSSTLKKPPLIPSQKMQPKGRLSTPTYYHDSSHQGSSNETSPIKSSLKNSAQFVGSKSTENISHIPIMIRTRPPSLPYSITKNVPQSISNKRHSLGAAKAFQPNLVKFKSCSLNNLSSFKKKNFSHVESKVKKYIQEMKAKEAANKQCVSLPSTPIRKRLTKSNSCIYDDDSLKSFKSMINISIDDIPDDIKALKEEMSQYIKDETALDKLYHQLVKERRSCLEQYELRSSLEIEYNKLLLKLAHAQDVIEFLRFRKEDTSENFERVNINKGMFFTSSPKHLSKSTSALNISYKSATSPTVSNHTKSSSSPLDQSTISSHNDSCQINARDNELDNSRSEDVLFISFQEWIEKYDELDAKINDYVTLQSVGALSNNEDRIIYHHLMNKHQEILNIRPKIQNISQENDFLSKRQQLSSSLDQVRQLNTGSRMSEAVDNLSDDQIYHPNSLATSITRDTAEILSNRKLETNADHPPKNFPSSMDKNILKSREDDLPLKDSFDYSAIFQSKSDMLDCTKMMDRKDNHSEQMASRTPYPCDNDSGCPPSDRSVNLTHMNAGHGGTHVREKCEDSLSGSSLLSAIHSVDDDLQGDRSSCTSSPSKKLSHTEKSLAEVPPHINTAKTVIESDSFDQDGEEEIERLKNFNRIKKKDVCYRIEKQPSELHKSVPKASNESYFLYPMNPTNSELSDSSGSSKSRHYISSIERDRKVNAGKLESLKKKGFPRTRLSLDSAVRPPLPMKAGLSSNDDLYQNKFHKARKTRRSEASLGHAFYSTPMTYTEPTNSVRRHKLSGGNSDSGLHINESLENLHCQHSISGGKLDKSSKRKSKSLTNFAHLHSGTSQPLSLRHPLIYIEHYNCFQDPNIDEKRAASKSYEDLPKTFHKRSSTKTNAKVYEALDEAAALANIARVTSYDLVKAMKSGTRPKQNKLSTL